MTAAAFVSRLRARGGSLALAADGALVLDGPSDLATPAVHAVVRQHAPALRAVLEAETRPAIRDANEAPGEPDPSRPCHVCRTTAWYRARDGDGPHVCPTCHPPSGSGADLVWTGRDAPWYAARFGGTAEAPTPVHAAALVERVRVAAAAEVERRTGRPVVPPAGPVEVEPDPDADPQPL